MCDSDANELRDVVVISFVGVLPKMGGGERDGDHSDGKSLQIKTNLWLSSSAFEILAKYFEPNPVNR